MIDKQLLVDDMSVQMHMGGPIELNQSLDMEKDADRIETQSRIDDGSVISKTHEDGATGDHAQTMEDLKDKKFSKEDLSQMRMGAMSQVTLPTVMTTSMKTLQTASALSTANLLNQKRSSVDPYAPVSSTTSVL